MGYTLLKMVIGPLLRLAFRIRVRGREHLPDRGAAILVANHVSFLDNLIIPLLVRRKVTFLAKAEYFDDRRVAWFFRMGGQIPIKREGGSSADRALASAREVLQSGQLLAIYPEGTRSPDGRLYKGRTGVARMALACGVPVVPIGLQGTAEAQPIGCRLPRPFRTVTVTIGAPLSWDEAPGAENDGAVLRRMTDEIVAAIADLTGQERVDHYAKRHRPDESVAARPDESVAARPDESVAARPDEAVAGAVVQLPDGLVSLSDGLGPLSGVVQLPDAPPTDLREPVPAEVGVRQPLAAASTPLRK